MPSVHSSGREGGVGDAIWKKQRCADVFIFSPSTSHNYSLHGFVSIFTTWMYLCSWTADFITVPPVLALRIYSIQFIYSIQLAYKHNCTSFTNFRPWSVIIRSTRPKSRRMFTTFPDTSTAVLVHRGFATSHFMKRSVAVGINLQLKMHVMYVVIIVNRHSIPVTSFPLNQIFRIDYL